MRFPKVMTCLNLGCPLGMGLWEGVPLREVIWLTQPREQVRRVFDHGFHNDDPKQMFRSSLPIGRVLEDPFDLPPVILCYKLNSEWLDPERGGPVRIVVPEAYGFKSIKWLTHVVLTNLAHANDTYAEQDNDVDSPLKTFAATISIPRAVKAGDKFPVSGYAQVGISGLSKVQVSIESTAKPRPTNDPYFTTAPWVDAELLAAPKRWDSLSEGKIPSQTHGFDSSVRTKELAAATYQCTLGCRTAGAPERRIHLSLPHNRRKRPSPAHAAPIPQIGPRDNRIDQHHRERSNAKVNRGMIDLALGAIILGCKCCLISFSSCTESSQSRLADKR